MATEKKITSRIRQKHDVAANWAKATNFIPQKGEIIIYDAEYNTSGEETQAVRFKIGDGSKTVNNLPFAVIDYSSDIGTLKQKVANNSTAIGALQENTVPKTRKINNKALSSDITLGAADVGVNETTFPGLKKTGTVTGVKMNGTTKNPSSGVVDLGTVLTDESAFATSAQGTKADNAMPKSGGVFTGNISVPKTITFTDTTNPYIKMTTGSTDFYFQSTSGQFGLGPTWDKATHWDSNGNVTFPTTPKVGNSSLALKSDISGKQDKLTAGSNISISGNTISATVPTVNNGTLTIQKNGTKVATFSANQSGNATANITVPVKVSELTNDSGFTTNKGTVTQVKINGTTKSPNSAGLVDLGTISGGGAQSSISVEHVVILSGETFDMIDISGGNTPTVAYGNFLGIATVSQAINAPTISIAGWDGSRWTDIKVIELKADSNADVSFEFMWDIGAGLFFIKTGTKGTTFSQSVINIPTNTTAINLEYQDNNTESSELRGVYYRGTGE